MGATDFKTPHLDRMAAEGARFTDWYSNSPVCSPSRRSIAYRTIPVPCRGPLYFIRASHRYRFAAFCSFALATALKDRGYYTAMSGKWHLGLAEGSRPEHHGFDDCVRIHGRMHRFLLTHLLLGLRATWYRPDT